ncbi:MAG: hypothetical protein JWP35_4818 [Caulobacter sp.]|nr:hypothetical protein [Caulobacter sp.]
MPICLDVSDIYCVPPAYGRVWLPGGIIVLTDRRGRRLHVNPVDIRRAGASINLMARDNIVVQPVTGFAERPLGGATLLYRSECIRFSCIFTTIVVANADLAEVRVYGTDALHQIRIDGVSRAGLNRSLKAIAVIGPGSDLIALAELR